MSAGRDAADAGSRAPLDVRGGPAHPVASRPGVGSISAQAWRVDAPAGTVADAVVPDTALEGRVVAPGDVLRFDWHPEAVDAPGRLRYAACAFALDLDLDDGTTLAAHGTVDQHGVLAVPAAQGDADMHWPDQWGRRLVALHGLAGRTVVGVRAVLGGDRSVARRGWLDAVAIEPRAEVPDELALRVDTRRGTHSSPDFSRGNTAPLVAVPHGGVFGLPMTDASSHAWPYSYHLHVDDRARPSIQAFATSHIPSPWTGDRGVLQVMPSPLEHPPLGRSARALTFERDAERAHPHRYDVALAGGIDATLVAARHAVGMRFRGRGPWLSLVLDHLGAAVDVAIDRSAPGRIAIDLVLDDERDAPPHHLHVELPSGAGDTLRWRRGRRRLEGSVRVPIAPGSAVDVRIGVSTIDAAHARRTLALAGDVDAIAEAARIAWHEVLGRVETDGASPAQEAAIRHALYRLHLYPNAFDEPDADGEPEHLDPVTRAVLPGPSSANHGFWDTYRTCWPLLALLAPRTTARLAEGFLQHFRDAGWTTRWSAPGPLDLMTGTSTDTVLADLVVDGVAVDARTAYASGLRNATTPAPERRVGRPGLRPAIFRGFTSTDVHEGLAWTLDDAVNDRSLAALAAWLRDRADDDAERERLDAEHEYLARRAQRYRLVLDRRTGFLVGRRPDGAWRAEPEAFDPLVWGGDYTETNAWGTRFSVPHDGAGLAEELGGEERLAAAIEEALATEEQASSAHQGWYGFVIHEMSEARDVRMGMLGMSNQPAHHIPCMAMAAGRHDLAQRLQVEARDRLFVGGELGQGFPGDEDDGEMAAWYLLAVLGLYPLVPASGTFVLTPPMLPRVVVTTETGARLEIRTTGAGRRWIAGVRIDGEPWDEVWVPRARLAAGALVEVDLADAPTSWAAASRPPSASVELDWRDPATDLLARGHAATDDVGATPTRLEPGGHLVLPLERPGRVGLVTVTLADAGEASWRIVGIDESGEEGVLDERRAAFAWPGQTRPFRARALEAPITAVRLEARSRMRLEQLECILAEPVGASALD